MTLSQLPPVFLVAFYALFWVWETLAAARPAVSGRFRRLRNLLFTLASIVIGGVSGAALLLLSDLFAQHRWGVLAQTDWPAWAVVILGILGVDLADYWRHRLSHGVALLWRLHRVHHSDVAIDVTTSFRNHPIEMLIRPLFLAIAIAVLGVPPLSLLILPLLQFPVLVFQHANIVLPARLDRALAFLFATPGMHVVHHSRAPSETDSNYATLFSIWDRLFASFRRSVEPAALGLKGFEDAQHQSVIGILMTPWR